MKILFFLGILFVLCGELSGAEYKNGTVCQTNPLGNDMIAFAPLFDDIEGITEEEFEYIMEALLDIGD